MYLSKKIVASALGAAALLLSAPAFAAFNYSVNYSDSSGNVSYPGSTTITTTNPLTFFTLSPGGSVTGSNLPTNIGLFSIVPISTAPTGTGPFAVTETHFTTVVSIQTVLNLDGTGLVGSPALFTVTGDITGLLGPDSDNTLISGIVGLPTSVTAGGVVYDITLDSIRSPGVVSSGGNTGGVTLHIAAVPEPASLSLLGIGAVGLLGRRRK